MEENVNWKKEYEDLKKSISIFFKDVCVKVSDDNKRLDLIFKDEVFVDKNDSVLIRNLINISKD